MTITEVMLDAARDSNGRSFLDPERLDDEDEQARRWGRVMVRRGPWPEGVDRLERGSSEWWDAADAERRTAHRIEDEEERNRALREIRARYGSQTTSRTLATFDAGLRDPPGAVVTAAPAIEPVGTAPATERGGRSNKQRSLAYRREVLIYLLREGFSDADLRRERRGVPEIERQRRDTGDIAGLPWTVAVRNQRGLDLSSAMIEVEREAQRAGSSLFASIQRRHGHPIESSYVTMPLSVFVAVLRMTRSQL